MNAFESNNVYAWKIHRGWLDVCRIQMMSEMCGITAGFSPDGSLLPNYFIKTNCSFEDGFNLYVCPVGFLITRQRPCNLFIRVMQHFECPTKAFTRDKFGDSWRLKLFDKLVPPCGHSTYVYTVKIQNMLYSMLECLA